MRTGFVLMWSSGFVGAALAAGTASTATTLMWRCLVAAVLIGGWWWLTRRRRLGLRELGLQALIGLLSQCVYLSGIFWSVDLGVPSGTAALVAALQPIVATVLGQFVLGEHASKAQWLGLAIGLGGVALVVGGDLSGGNAPALAYALPVLAMLGLVAATLLERRAGVSVELGDSLAIQCVTSAVVFTGVAAASGQLVPPASGSFWFAIGWVVVLSTFGGYGFYWLNLRRGSVTSVSSLLYLTPPTTMLAGFLLFDETLDVRGLLGVAVCALAVFLVLRKPRSSGKVPPEPARCPAS
ncbi:DMT family transporter [Amycolatopsis sp. 195334CR]|uniref:DMT family transporter n=1 Tax=Amycolatopsis sp. 195334CR TaxID=2814588 RepID=UPI001A8CD70C|nr:DMT family transporter [Amycolatopsis sp. 195334CR]MBN6035489.1 DMT family transporter [Amycolatopsis sp. 195334CR]